MLKNFFDISALLPSMFGDRESGPGSNPGLGVTWVRVVVGSRPSSSKKNTFRNPTNLSRTK